MFVRYSSLAFVLSFLPTTLRADNSIAVYRTSAAADERLASLPSLKWSTSPSETPGEVAVDPSQRFQTIVGMGSSLEPTTAFNLAKLNEADRREVMEKLFDPVKGIGMNLMRICIGTPDFTGDPWYSYDDLPAGVTDPDLAQFSIEKDKAYLIPVIQQALATNQDLLIFASPWSPPGWMKSTGTMIGGRLDPKWYDCYARYFVKFIRAYEAEGIPIHAVTVQNEPGVDRSKETDPKWFYPSCRWTGEEEAEFIRDHLGPLLKKQNIPTQIWCYDHNYNTQPTADGDDPGLAYPRTILSDAKSAGFVAGVAFHGYAGKPENMISFQREFPSVPLHFTEGSVFGLLGTRKLFAILQSGAVSYNAWVTMTDTEGKPNNGPFPADTTCLRRDVATNKPIYHLDFSIMGHFMKFIPRGSTRIHSQAARGMDHVAFIAPDGSVRLVLMNALRSDRTLRLKSGNRSVSLALPGQSITTLIWSEST